MTRFLVLVLVAVLLAAAVVAGLALERRPLVVANTALTGAEIEHVRRLLAEQDPRRVREGTLRRVTISSRDATLLSNYLLARLGNGGAQVIATEDRLSLQASLALPDNPLGGYLNIAAILREADGLPEIESLRIGKLILPDVLTSWAYRRLLAWIDNRSGNAVTDDVVRQVAIGDDRIEMMYQWRTSLITTIGSGLVDAQLFERVALYQNLLFAGLDSSSRGTIALTALLQAVMTLAEDRSIASDPVDENRAAIIALEAFVNRRDFGGLLPAAPTRPAGRRAAVNLDGRRDFAQHYMLSAALVAFSDKAIAQAIGLSKELNDSVSGSGFSFRDLVADNAGTRFGQLAVNPATARAIQRMIASGIDDRDIIPATGDLMESLTERQFRAQFGGIDDDRFRRVTQDIDRRIAALPLYSEPE